jgi:hypothetical protein
MTEREQNQQVEQESIAAATPDELTDRQLDEVSGGIIIVGGRLAAPSFSLQSFSAMFGWG